MKTSDALAAEVRDLSWRLDAALRLAHTMVERYNECVKASHPPETLDEHWAEIQEYLERIKALAPE